MAVLVTIGFVASCAFGFAPHPALLAANDLRASAPPREKYSSTFTNSEGHVYQMAYDGQGRLIAATNAIPEQVFRNFFDSCGHLTCCRPN